MTIYKAVRNFLTVFVVLAVAAGALGIGGGVYYAVQSAASSQVLSKLGSKRSSRSWAITAAQPMVFTAMPPRRR